MFELDNDIVVIFKLIEIISMLLDHDLFNKFEMNIEPQPGIFNGFSNTFLSKRHRFG